MTVSVGHALFASASVARRMRYNPPSMLICTWTDIAEGAIKLAITWLTGSHLLLGEVLALHHPCQVEAQAHLHGADFPTMYWYNLCVYSVDYSCPAA